MPIIARGKGKAWTSFVPLCLDCAEATHYLVRGPHLLPLRRILPEMIGIITDIEM
jgi:hypothetical protein